MKLKIGRARRHDVLVEAVGILAALDCNSPEARGESELQVRDSDASAGSLARALRSWAPGASAKDRMLHVSFLDSWCCYIATFLGFLTKRTSCSAGPITSVQS